MNIFLIILAAVITLLVIFITSAQKCEKKPCWVGKSPIAHRGLHNEIYPENSFAAFENSIKKGYAIETDVHLTKDNKVVIFHDFNLKRMCGADVLIEDLTFEQTQEYFLGETTQKIPLFSDFIKFAGGKVPLLIELKNAGAAGDLEEYTYEILKNYKGEYAVQSFSPFSIRWFYKNAPQIPRGQLSFSPKVAQEYLSKANAFILGNLYSNFFAKPNFISYEVSGLENKCVQKLKNAGIPVLAWTVRTKEQKMYSQKLCTNIIFENEEIFEEEKS